MSAGVPYEQRRDCERLSPIGSNPSRPLQVRPSRRQAADPSLASPLPEFRSAFRCSEFYIFIQSFSCRRNPAANPLSGIGTPRAVRPHARTEASGGMHANTITQKHQPSSSSSKPIVNEQLRRASLRIAYRDRYTRAPLAAGWEDMRCQPAPSTEAGSRSTL